jgi:GH35 family endo-1,4-beta-xylanase
MMSIASSGLNHISTSTHLFQSHVTARPYWFVNKNDLRATFARLAGLGADALVTEIDIALVANTTADARYQAAIWGDYLDVSCVSLVNFADSP